MEKKEEVLIPGSEDTGKRIDKFISSSIYLARSQVKRMILEGKITIEGRRVSSPHYKVKKGERIHLKLVPSTLTSLIPENIPLDIIYENSHLLVINKPPGLIVHPAGKVRTGTLVNAILYHCGEEILRVGGNERAGLVHRLDKDTSGVMVIAKDNSTHSELSRQFLKREIDKTYVALAWGIPQKTSGEISTPIGRSTGDRKKMSIFSAKPREAITFFRVKEVFRDFSLLEIKPKTGRTHQIRVHLASIGHVVVGDPLYGGKRRIHSSSLKDFQGEIKRQLLHAYRIGFHYSYQGKFVEFTAPLPKDMKEVILWSRKHAK